MTNRIIAFLILMVIIIGITSPLSFAETKTADTIYYCKDMSEGIIALKEVSAFKVTLSNGSILSTAISQTETEVDIEENMKDVELVLILDASGSMSGRRNATTKTATKELVDALFDKIGTEHLKIGTIFFASNIGATLPLTNDKNAIQNQLSTLPASGGTYMSTALDRAREWLTATSGNDTIKIICTLSDGALMDSSQAKNSFTQIHAAGISTMSIFVETAIGSPFSELPDEKHKNFTTTTAGLSQTIATDLYNEIYFKIILLMDPKTKYNISDAVIIPGDSIMITADDEIVHGATLQVEYVFMVNTTFDVKNIEIKDIPENFTFNPNQKLLTENKTNNDYHWNYDASSRTIVSNSGNINLGSTREYKVKLVLSSLVTPEILHDTGRFKNCAEFKIKKDDDRGTVVQVKNNTANDPNETRIKALDILIIPPTGNYATYLFEKIVTAIIVVVALLVVIIWKKGHASSIEKRGHL